MTADIQPAALNPDRERAAQFQFGAGPGLEPPDHVVVIGRGKAVGGVGGAEAVVDAGIAGPAGAIDQQLGRRGEAGAGAG